MAVNLWNLSTHFRSGGNGETGIEDVESTGAPNETDVKAISFLSDLEVRNPENAREYGIKGYLEVKLASSSSYSFPSSPVYIRAEHGRETKVAVHLHFVSYTDVLSEIEVVLNSTGPWGLRIEQPLPNGETVDVNRLVRYEPSGAVKLKADQTLEVNMIISIPEDFELSSFPLGAVGVYTNPDVPIIDTIWVEVAVVRPEE